MLALTTSIGLSSTNIIDIRFLRSELLHDIAQRGFLEADSMPTEDEHRNHQTADVIEDGNKDLILRSLRLAYHTLAHALYPYTEEYTYEGDWMDDTLTDPEEYILSLKVPEDFATSTHNLLTSLAHEFMTAYAIADYFPPHIPRRAVHTLSVPTSLKQRCTLH